MKKFLITLFLCIVVCGCGALRSSEDCIVTFDIEYIIITYSPDRVYRIPYDKSDNHGIEEAFSNFNKDRERYRYDSTFD